MELNELRRQFYETALPVGIPVISGDKCCQILAWLFIYGGANEQTIINERLRDSILYAQRRLNINGGELPDKELVPVLQSYIKSVVDWVKPPDWVLELEKEFGIKPYGRPKKERNL